MTIDIEELRAALRDMLFAYQNKDADCPRSFEERAVARAMAAAKCDEIGNELPKDGAA